MPTVSVFAIVLNWIVIRYTKSLGAICAIYWCDVIAAENLL
jgi:hypothetical protein